MKAVKKVGQGKVKDEGKVWFTQLRDKRTLFELLCVVLIFVLCSERSLVKYTFTTA